MSRLARKFAGIVLVAVAEERLDALTADRAALEAQGLQWPSSEPTNPLNASLCGFTLNRSGRTTPASWQRSQFPWLSVGSASKSSQPTSAKPPWPAERLRGSCSAHGPATASTEALGSMLEGLADELMVEIRLSED
jgi:glycine cleavage system regulatory protein